MKHIDTVVAVLVGLIGLVMIATNLYIGPPLASGLAFILIATSIIKR